MESLRPRVLLITLGIGLVIALAPTPFPHALVEPVQAGLTSLQAGRPDLALQEFEHALTLEPTLPGLHLRSAQAALQAGEDERAQAHLGELSAQTEETTCLWAGVSIALEEWMPAVQLLDSSPVSCPAQLAQLQEAIDGLILTGDHTAAIPLLEVMARLQPGWSQIRLGWLYAVREPERALSHLSLAAELDPQTADQTKQMVEVIEAARTAGDSAYSLAQVGQSLARAGEWSLAAEAFSNALAIRPDYTEARAYLGLALDQMGKDGLAHLEQSAAEAPESALPQVLLGRHWWTRGDPTRALEAFEQAAALAPDDPLIAVDLAAAYASAGDLISAKASYIYAAELESNDPFYWKRLSQFSLDHDIEVESLGLPAARQAVMLSPGDASALDLLGFSHYLLGNWNLAGRFLERAIQADDQSASSHYHLGLLNLVLGDLAAGRQALQAAVLLDEGGRVGTLARRSLENLGLR